MAPAVDNMETLLIGEQLKTDGNPIMTWCAANAVTTADAAGNRKLDKSKATGRIDGMVAATMAAGIAIKQNDAMTLTPDDFAFI
jgi:phage terminase large subunit-like protein